MNQDKQLTVGELKKIIADVPDETPIFTFYDFLYNMPMQSAELKPDGKFMIYYEG